MGALVWARGLRAARARARARLRGEEALLLLLLLLLLAMHRRAQALRRAAPAERGGGPARPSRRSRRGPPARGRAARPVVVERVAVGVGVRARLAARGGCRAEGPAGWHGRCGGWGMALGLGAAAVRAHRRLPGCKRWCGGTLA